MEGSGNGLEIGFNNRYMMEALKAASREKSDPGTVQPHYPLHHCPR